MTLPTVPVEVSGMSDKNALTTNKIQQKVSKSIKSLDNNERT